MRRKEEYSFRGSVCVDLTGRLMGAPDSAPFHSSARYRRKPLERLEIRFDHDAYMLTPARRAGSLFGLANQPRRNGVARPELDDEAAISEGRPRRRVISIRSGLPMRRNPHAIDLDRVFPGFNRSGVGLGTHPEIAG